MFYPTTKTKTQERSSRQESNQRPPEDTGKEKWKTHATF